MAEKWFEDLKNKVEAFIADASDDELKSEFEKANYKFYKEIKTPILWYNFKRDAFAFRSTYTVLMKSCTLAYDDRQWSEIRRQDSADDFSFSNYSIAA